MTEPVSETDPMLSEMGVFASLANNEIQASVSGLNDYCPKCGVKL